MNVRVRSRAALALLAILVPAILFLTLTPSDSRTAAAFTCLICGERGLADVILNVIMFMPLGILAALAFGMSPAIVIAAAAFSAGVEVTQFFIPGRDASPGDLLFNTLGAGLGLFVVGSAHRWARPRRAALPLYATAAALVTAGTVFATGRLVRVVFSDVTWYARHTPDLPHLELYGGEVVEAHVGDVELRGTGRMPSELRDTLRSLLASGEEVRVRLVAGPPPPGVAAFVTIYDEFRREMLLVGADGTDLVIRMRIVAEDARLDKWFPRLRGALAGVPPGEGIEVAGRFDGGTWCLSVGRETTCGIGMDPSRGWKLLYSADSFPHWTHVLASLLWTAVLGGVAGFYARTVATTIAGAAAVVVAFIVLPVLDPFLTATPVQALIAAVVGFAAALWLGRRVGLRDAVPASSGSAV